MPKRASKRKFNACEYGAHRFTSARQFTKYVQAEIYSQHLGPVDNKNPFHDLLIFLIQRHPRSIQKLGCCTLIEVRFEICSNPITPKYREMKLLRPDGSSESFSWRTCVSSDRCEIIDTFMKRLTSAMRFSIREQINDFRRITPLPAMCPGINCKTSCSSNHQWHVDHERPTFRELRDNFLSSTKLPIPNNFGKEPNTHQDTFLHDDQTFERNWNEFHQGFARLRWLCQACNLSRPKSF